MALTHCARTLGLGVNLFVAETKKSQTRPWLTCCLNEVSRKALQLFVKKKAQSDNSNFITRTAMGQARELLPEHLLQLPLRSQWNAKEQWRLLLTFHDKLIRDAAFIILCPCLLDNSMELPMVDHSVLACNGDNWHATIAWLRALDPTEVSKWFAGRKRNSRLGDHFADCVEFVLRFAPAFRPSRLEISIQVHYNVPCTPPTTATPLHPVQVVSKTTDAKDTESPLEWDDDQMSKLNNSHTACEGNGKKEGRGKCFFEENSIMFLRGRGAEEGGVGDVSEDGGRGGANGRRQSRRERKKFWRESHNRTAVTTVGEFDVLFTLKPDKECAKEEIHHWELTTKFLLYIGPSQVLGLPTENGAGADEVKCEEGGEVLGWYLGPHCGESLRTRKDRLCRQLRLSQTELGGGVVRELYGEVAQEGAVGEVLPVVPSAFVAGYLFYKFPLWKEMGERGFTFPEGDEVGADVVPPGSATSMSSRVNPYHWTGWWTNDLQELVQHPEACESRWYIIPKLEWLSPVLILGSDEDGLHRVLTGKDVLEVSRKMGDEARAKNLPKKLRFLVAEVQWIEDLACFNEDVGDVIEGIIKEGCPFHGLKRNSCANCEGDGSVKELKVRERIGGWVEVSRGCLVEETWPQTSDAKSHCALPTQLLVIQRL